MTTVNDEENEIFISRVATGDIITLNIHVSSIDMSSLEFMV